MCAMTSDDQAFVLSDRMSRLRPAIPTSSGPPAKTAASESMTSGAGARQLHMLLCTMAGIFKYVLVVHS